MSDLPLTSKQKSILEFIDRYRAYKGYSPRLVDIQEFLGAKSHQTVSDHIKRLEAKGMVRRKKNGWRSIEIIGNY